MTLRSAALAASLALGCGCGALGPPPGPPDPCDRCASDQTCVSGECHEAQLDCLGVAGISATAGDGLYRLELEGKMQYAYCDMRTQRVLCAETMSQRTGAARSQPAREELSFKLMSRLELPGSCRIWAVQTDDGVPLDKLERLDSDPSALVSSTCQALGFKGGDQGLVRQCRFGSGFDAHCGFEHQKSVPERSKYGNSSTGLNKPYFTLEREVNRSDLPWNFDGSMSSTCRVTSDD